MGVSTGCRRGRIWNDSSSSTGVDRGPEPAAATRRARHRGLPEGPHRPGQRHEGRPAAVDGLPRRSAPRATPWSSDGSTGSPRPPTGSVRRAGSRTPNSGASIGSSPNTRDQWLDQLPTIGALTQFPPDKLAEVLDRVGDAIDAIGGGFTMTYTTLAATATVARTSAT